MMLVFGTVLSFGGILYIVWKKYSHASSEAVPAPDTIRLDLLAASFEKLGALHREGKLTDEEFEAAKAKALVNPYIPRDR